MGFSELHWMHGLLTLIMTLHSMLHSPAARRAAWAAQTQTSSINTTLAAMGCQHDVALYASQPEGLHGLLRLIMPAEYDVTITRVCSTTSGGPARNDRARRALLFLVSTYIYNYSHFFGGTPRELPQTRQANRCYFSAILEPGFAILGAVCCLRFACKV